MIRHRAFSEFINSNFRNHQSKFFPLFRLDRFFPKVQNIDVGASPVSGITFSQLRATVTGDVKCLTDIDGASHCKSITITLHSLDVDGKRNGQTVKSVLKNGKYSFVDVLPGTYEVSVPTNLLCWESNTLALNVKSATEVVPTFVHTGYLVTVSSSHNTKVKTTTNVCRIQITSNDLPSFADDI